MMSAAPQHDTTTQERREVPAPAPGVAARAPSLGLAAPAGGTAYRSFEEAGEDLLRELAEPAPAPRPAGLTIGRANDPAEADADRLADHVMQAMRRPASAPSAPIVPPSGGGTAGLARSANPGTDPLGGTAVQADVTQRLRSRSGQGSALPKSLSDTMGGHMQADLSRVRVHTDGEADTISRSLQAKAFTVGHDVYFTRGTYDPGSESGKHLLAHELAHVAQQSTPVRRLWSMETFKDETTQGRFTGKAKAQEELILLIGDYHREIAKNGDISPNNVEKAFERLELMERVIDNYLAEHTTVSQKTDKEQDDPTRGKRMAGFRKFKSSLDVERSGLHDKQEHFKQSGQRIEKGGERWITESKGHRKIQEKYDNKKITAKDFFQQMGDRIASLVTDDESLEIEASVKFPADPSGISTVGGRLKGEVEREGGMVSLNAELAATCDADVWGAKVGGELGGYIKTKAKTGAECMELLSYALYRRARESDVIPHEAANVMWGEGHASSYGFAKAENWSRDLEKRMWGVEPEPQRKDFSSDELFTAAHDEWQERSDQVDDTYVETGALAGLSAEAGASLGVASAAASVEASFTSGSRIDKTSLGARKGGAGEKNRMSDGKVASFTRDLLGQDRGAQKRVGRTINTFSVGGGVGASAPGFAIGGASEFSARWSSDGSHGPAGKPKFDKAELSFTGTFGMPSVLGVGKGLDQLVVGWGKKLGNWLQDSAFIPAAAVDKKNNDPGMTAVGVVELAAQRAPETLGKELAIMLAEKLAEMGGISGSGSETYKMKYTADLLENTAEIEFSRTSGVSIELPKSVEFSISKTSKLLKLKMDVFGEWTAKVFAQ